MSIVRPSSAASTSFSPSYFSFREKKGRPVSSRRRKILSPSHRGRDSRSCFWIHASYPSSQGWAVPVQPAAVNRCMYSVGYWSDTKVTSPR